MCNVLETDISRTFMDELLEPLISLSDDSLTYWMKYYDIIKRTWQDNTLFSALIELTYRCNLDCLSAITIVNWMVNHYLWINIFSYSQICRKCR